MRVDMKNEFLLTVTTPEIRLIVKALGGRLQPDELQAARKLSDEISRMRAATSINGLKKMEELLGNLGGAGQPDGGQSDGARGNE